MSNNNFEIEIKISFIENELQPEFTKSYIYHSNKSKEFYDSITFSNNVILISGNRNKEINPENALYSPQSRLYRECISSLLYVYAKYGHFKIDSFQINDYVVTDYNQKFTTSYDFNFSEEILNRLFHFKNNLLYTPLLHLVEGFSMKNYQLEHSWKSFNYIYNYITGNTKDEESIKKIINICDCNKDYFELVYKESKRLFFDKIDTGKIIFYLTNKTSNKSLIIDKFREYFKTRDLNDRELLERLLEIFESIFYKLEKDYILNKKSSTYKLLDTQAYAREKNKMLSRKNKNYTEITEYLPIVLDYIQFLRNKSMHGVLQSSAFLFETKNTEDQKRFADFMTLFCVELLKWVLDTDNFSYISEKSKD